MDFRFSDDFFKVLEFSRDEAVRTGWHNIGADHIMLAILRHGNNDACRALEASGVDLTAFKCHIDDVVFVDEAIPWEDRESVNFCDGAQSMLHHAALEAARCGDEVLTPLHFLLAVCRISGSYSHDYLDDCGVSLKTLVESSGMEWSEYRLDRRHEGASASTPDPQLLAEAIEKRLREGYTTDNPNVS